MGAAPPGAGALINTSLKTLNGDWLAQNPAYVAQNWGKLSTTRKSQLAKAGYRVHSSGGRYYLRNEKAHAGRNLWSWAPENYIKMLPDYPGGGPKPGTKVVIDPASGKPIVVPDQDDPSGAPSLDIGTAPPGSTADTQLRWSKPPQTKIPGQYGANLSKEMKLLSKYIDPMAYMKMVSSGFNPAIQAMTQEISRRESRPSGMDGSLKAWYEQLIGANNAGAGATSDAAAQIMAGHDASTQGLANVLGGSASPAAASAGAYGQIGRNELEQMTMAQDRLEGAQGSNLALEGVEQRLLAQRQNTGEMDQLRQALIELTAEQGMSKSKAYMDAYTQRIGQVNDVADMKTLNSMNKWEQAKAGQSLISGNQQIRGQALDLDIKRLQAKMGLEKANEGSVPAFSKLDPSQYGTLRQNLRNSVMNGKGQVIRDPAQIMDMFGRAIRSTSGGGWDAKTNPEVDRWRDDLVQELIPIWNQQHPKRKYAWRDGRLIKL